jgi:hypothetical protein
MRFAIIYTMNESIQSETVLCGRESCRKPVPSERMRTLTGRARRAGLYYCSLKCQDGAKHDRWLNKPGIRDWQTENQRKKRERFPKRYILIRSRGNAKMRCLENTLTEVDIPDIPEFCPVFPWIRLVYRVGQTGRGQKAFDDAPSLDRIDNAKGYVPGNVRIISYKANKAKSDLTDRELIALGDDARRQN